VRTPRPPDLAPPDPVSTWSRPGRAAGYIAGSALLAGTALALLDAAGLLGPGPAYRHTGAGPLVDQATFYAAYFGHQHHIVHSIGVGHLSPGTRSCPSPTSPSSSRRSPSGTVPGPVTLKASSW
jgi:hypothetical protein